MKVLIFTRSEWSDENSTGNTMSNIFGDFDKTNIANIYVRDAKPNNNVCDNYYSVSDIQIFKSLLKIKTLPGKHFKNNLAQNQSINNKTSFEKKLYNFFRNRSKLLPFMFQNLLWNTNKWKNENLDNFLNEFKPDIIFSPSFYTVYTHKILWYLQKKTNAKIVLFHADDYLMLTENNGVKKLLNKNRKKTIIKSINLASLNYCISQEQQVEYQNELGKKMKLLYKGGVFNEFPLYSMNNEKTIRIIYIGTLQYGRWKTISQLVKSIKEVNEKSTIKFTLDIYSQYKPDKKMLNKIEIKDISKFKGKIPNNRVIEEMKKSDIVLHVESFDETEKSLTRLSFSTKIVDCLSSGRTLLAIGDTNLASINYLLKNDAAIIARTENSIKDHLIEIQNNPTILNEYAVKGWKTGVKNHKLSTVRNKFYNELDNLIKDVNKNENSTN
ncbi:glycosyltransferase [Mammaliicoccus sp. F-M27]|uniref:glycosyltransferase n=1 Tax=Mammaliicoccus sp. F-M27 TaxID=2898687 RepID=UPI001EFBBCFC|nr:glycosyltransferase [Mammaliicoccus sp. F-M27]